MDRMNRTIAVVSVAALLVTAGCLGGLTTSEDRSADEIQTDALSAMESVESYSFDLTMSINTSGTSAGGMMAGGFELTSSGKIDMANEQMQMQMSMPMFGSVETYIVDDTKYTTSPFSDEWQREPAGEDLFGETMMDLTDTRELLDDANVTYEGTEELDGRTVNVLRVNVSEEAIAGLLDEEVEGEQTPSSSYGADMIDQFDIVFYIGQQDDLLYRMNLDASISGDLGTGPESMDFDIELTMDDYNEDFDIQPPPEATE